MFKRVLMVFVLMVSGVVTLAQDAPEPVTVLLPFMPNVQFAPVYVAMEKGYFEAAGFDVTLEYGSEPDGVERLAVDDLDFAFVGGEQVILARANARPVVFIYEWYQRTPIGVVVVGAESDNLPDSPAALVGERVGVPGRFGATYSGLVSMLAAADLSESDVMLEEIGFNAPDVVCAGGVNAAAVYLNNEPLQIRERVAAGECGDVTTVAVMAAADYADLVSNGLAVSETAITEQPQRVAAFVAAFERGLADTLSNPAEAYLLSAAHVEGLSMDDVHLTELAQAETTPEALVALRDELDADIWVQLVVLLETLPLWEAEQLGYTDADAWQLTADTLLSMGFLSSEADLTGAYTNDFLPEAE